MANLDGQRITDLVKESSGFESLMTFNPYLITYEGVLALHHDLIIRFGGDATPKPKAGCIEASLGAAWSAELYQDNEGGQEGFCFAGCLLFYLAHEPLLYGRQQASSVGCLHGGDTLHGSHY